MCKICNDAAPANTGKLDIALQNLPPADDYFLLFLNSTHGVMYGSSQRFSILAAGSTPTNGSSPTPASGVPTITLSSTPDPNLLFATVFPAIANGALGWRTPAGAGAPLLLAGLTCLLSAFMDIDAVVRADTCVRVYVMMTCDDDTYLFITPGIMLCNICFWFLRATLTLVSSAVCLLFFAFDARVESWVYICSFLDRSCMDISFRCFEDIHSTPKRDF